MPEGKEVVPVESSYSVMSANMPLTAYQARQAMELYQEICEAILTDDDYQTIMLYDPVAKKKLPKKFKKKSGARKLAKAYRISTEIIKDERVDLPEGRSAWVVAIRATSPDGRAEEADGLVEKEDNPPHNTWHNIRATALTRAKNRAIFDLVGMGEVSAEEVHAGNLESESQPGVVVTTEPADEAPDLPPYKWVSKQLAEEKGYITDYARTFVPKDGKMEGVELVLKEELRRPVSLPESFSEPDPQPTPEEEPASEKPKKRGRPPKYLGDDQIDQLYQIAKSRNFPDYKSFESWLMVGGLMKDGKVLATEYDSIKERLEKMRVTD